MTTFFVTLLIALIALSIWNLISIKGLKKYNKSSIQITDDRYYELKYKTEYITTIVIVVISVGAFFGYKWFEEIKKSAADNLKNKTDLFEAKFDSLKLKIRSTDTSIIKYQSLVVFYKNSFDNLLHNQEKIDKNIQNSDNELSVIIKRIQALNNKNIVKQDIYLIDIKFPMNNSKQIHRYYYKDLTTTLGDKLPVFNKPPFLIAVADNIIDLWVMTIDKDYFEVSTGDYSGLPDSVRFSIMLSQK